MSKLRELSEKLTQTESSLSAFFNLCPVLFTIANKKGFFCKVNNEWEKQFGWTPEELCARPYVTFIHPDDLEKTIEAQQRLNRGEPLGYFVNRYRCKDGSYKSICWNASPYADGIYTYTTSYVVEESDK